MASRPVRVRTPRGGFLAAYARMLVRVRWIVLIGWVLLAAVAFVYQPPRRGGGLDGLVSLDDPAVRTEVQSFKRFGFP